MGLDYSTAAFVSIALLALGGAVRSYRAFRKREDAFDEMLRQGHSKKYSPRQSFLALCAIDKRLELDLCKDLRTLLFRHYLDGAPFAPACPDARLLFREEVQVQLGDVVRDALLVAQGKKDGGSMTLLVLVPVDGIYYALVQRTWHKKKRRRKSTAYIFGHWHKELFRRWSPLSYLRFPMSKNVAGPWMSIYMSTQAIDCLHKLRESRGLGLWTK